MHRNFRVMNKELDMPAFMVSVNAKLGALGEKHWYVRNGRTVYGKTKHLSEKEKVEAEASLHAAPDSRLLDSVSGKVRNGVTVPAPCSGGHAQID